MSKRLHLPGNASRQESPRKGFAGREGLAELLHSEEYSQAIHRITSSMDCTDIRELLRLLPECFKGVVKIEISRDAEPPFISAFVQEDKVVFSGASHSDESFVRTDIPLILRDASNSRSVGNMRVLSFTPLSLDIYRPGDKEDTEKVLGMLGSLIARTIDAKLDGLTALPVRKYFDHALEEHVARFMAEGRNFSLIYLDIDHFKKLNDDFGHDGGDRVLASLARILHNGVRGRSDCSDMVFRTGGEEFAVLLSGVPVEEAAKIAQRLRLMIKMHDFGLGRPVTCSFGVADVDEVSGSDRPGEDLYKMADSRLYEAKMDRDSVISARGSSHIRLKAVQMPEADAAANKPK